MKSPQPWLIVWPSSMPRCVLNASAAPGALPLTSGWACSTPGPSVGIPGSPRTSCAYKEPNKMPCNTHMKHNYKKHLCLSRNKTNGTRQGGQMTRTLPVLRPAEVKPAGSWGQTEQRVEGAFKAVQGSLCKGSNTHTVSNMRLVWPTIQAWML